MRVITFTLLCVLQVCTLLQAFFNFEQFLFPSPTAKTRLHGNFWTHRWSPTSFTGAKQLAHYGFAWTVGRTSWLYHASAFLDHPHVKLWLSRAKRPAKRPRSNNQQPGESGVPDEPRNPTRENDAIIITEKKTATINRPGKMALATRPLPQTLHSIKRSWPHWSATSSTKNLRTLCLPSKTSRHFK